MTGVQQVENPASWLNGRLWASSGNRTGDEEIDSTAKRTIYLPSSASDVAAIVRESSNVPISCVAGGHEASNINLLATDCIILDLQKMKDIHIDQDSMEVTVQAGVVFRELSDALRDVQGALPVGTGPTIGVIGYVVNAGLSGYFSRRLGLLGQCATKFTYVDATGEIQEMTGNDGEAFLSFLGAGSALGVVTSMTFRYENESILKSATQYVVGVGGEESAKKSGLSYYRKSLQFLRDVVLPNETVSLEIVLSANAVVVTTVFYDTFDGAVSTEDFLAPLREGATAVGLEIVHVSEWTTWYEAASALWPIIESMEGSPLKMIQHACGTTTDSGRPNDAILDFVADTFSPLAQADSTIAEARSLGGAIGKGTALPTGNYHIDFFVDLIVLYDGSQKTEAQKKELADKTGELVELARNVPSLKVDFSGTHAQVDDKQHPVRAEDIFGTAAMAGLIQQQKTRLDPENRFRFHPYAQLL